MNKYIYVNKAKNDDKVGELHIEGFIDDFNWWDESVTPSQISQTLDSLGDIKKLKVFIDSYGGSVFAGNAIVSIIDHFKAKKKCKVEGTIMGVAASMASGIAMACDKLFMHDNALFMLHKPLAELSGNADDLEKEIGVLNKCEDCLVANYMRKFNESEVTLRKLLADTTWLTAEEARDYGFVDEVIEGDKVFASAKGMEVNNATFRSKMLNIYREKYPNKKIEEENNLTYDEKLKNYGISEEMFNSYNLESEKIIAIADVVKDNFKVEPQEPVEQFVDKQSVCDALECEDITAEELINFAKVGKNPVEPKVDETISNKANAYDEIVDKLKEEALKNAVRAKGDNYNEERCRKMLNALDYGEIVDQNNEWIAEAEKALNAGVRKSEPINEETISPIISSTNYMMN